MTRDGTPDEPLPFWRVLEEEYRELHVQASDAAWEKGWREEIAALFAERNGAEPPDEVLEAALYQRVHALPGDAARTALCLSGGGIRSAAFGLGVLQGLARRGLLARFHYLSTVSGGGYIGSWLSSWIHRHPEGLLGAQADLAASATRPADSPGPAHPVRQLRRYSNYLSPRAGVFSADTWTLVATFVRNLLANWLVLLPFLMLLLLLPRLVLAVGAAWALRGGTVSFPLLLSVLAAAWVSGVAAVKYAHDEDEEFGESTAFPGRSPAAEAEFLVQCLLPIAFSVLLLVIALAWYRVTDLPREVTWKGMVVPLPLLGGALFGASVHWVGWLWSTEKRQSPRDDLWILLSGLLAGLAGGLAAQFVPAQDESATKLVVFVWLAPTILLVLFVAGVNMYVAWTGSGDRTTDADMEWTARMTAEILRAAVLWLLVAGVTFYGPVLFDLLPRVVTAGGLAGLFGSSVVAGWSGKTESNPRSKPVTRGSWLLDAATRVAGPLFLLVILAFLSGATSWLAGLTRDEGWAAKMWSPTGQDVGLPWDEGALRGLWSHLQVLADLNLAGVLALAVLLYALFWFSARYVALNKFSLHHMYRERLIRAFLGASRSIRRPDPFTGFDPDDNLPLGLLWPLAVTPAAVRDAAGLVGRLSGAAAPIPQATLRRLSQGLRDRLAVWVGGEVPATLLTDVCAELNRLVVNGRPLGSLPTDGLTREDIPEAHRGLWDELRKDGYDDYKERLFNRLMLEAAFGDTLRGSWPGHGSRPLHLINVTLNLSEDPELAWQDRKGESFTMSALHAGSADRTLGFRRTDFPFPREERRYGGDRGISLGTAMAISGAAASPNMGYHSSPVITFLLTLFNARLGWWLGNPGPAGAETYPDYYVRQPVRWLLRELRGRTTRTAEYVYLSDGGHFENLGLYEMVRRRCRFIVVSDAGCDPEAAFEDLGNAIRKIRIDFGIPIEFPDGLPIYSRVQAAREGAPGSHFAVARIDYSRVDQRAGGPKVEDGVLLYIKPAVYGVEPVDVRNYATRHRQFPHETTADQWFAEAQLESYRALGFYEIERALEHAPAGGIGAQLEGISPPKRPSRQSDWHHAL